MTRRHSLLVLLAAAALLLPGNANFAQEPAAKKIRVACIGDSITFGSGVKDREKNAYPAVLQELLGEGCEVKNFGVSGATLLNNGDKPYTKQDAFQQACALDPNVVIIKLGTNDTKPQNWSKKEAFVADLRSMVDQFAALPAKPRVWLCLPVPVFKTNFGINAEGLAEAMAMIKQVAEEKHLGLIDLHTALEPHPELFPDGIHPNAEGAAIMAQTVRATAFNSAAGK